MTELNGQLLSVHDVAVILDVHEQTVREYAKSGNLKAHKLPGSRVWKFWYKDVISFVNSDTKDGERL